MKKLFTIIISSLLLLSSVLTSCETVEQTKVGSIYGIVTKEGSTEPLSAIPVGLYKDNIFTDNSLMLQTVTYGDGHFEFDNLIEGYYNVRIDAMGYEIQEYSVYVESQRVARADMQLKLIDTGLHVITKDPVISNGVVKFSMSVEYDKSRYTELGFYYSTSSNPTQGGKQVKISSASAVYELKDIESGKYYVVAYAVNDYGTTYGEVKSFTFKIQPIMSVEVLNVTNSSASFTCHIENADKITMIERGFVYSSYFSIPSVDDPNPETIKRIVSGVSEDFSANVANLSFDYKYYVRAYIKLSSGIYYSEVVSFKANKLNIPEFEFAGQTYQVSPDQGALTWSKAISACSNLVYGGYSAWVLPDIGTLDIMYENKSEIGGFSSAGYWSSTESGGLSGYALGQNFSNGSQYGGSKSDSYRVRCVRKQ